MKYIILLTTILLGCGSEGGSDKATTLVEPQSEEPTTNQYHTMALDTADDLPDCNGDNDNQLAYVKDEDQFYECDGGDWVGIDIHGQDGADGEDGDVLSLYWTDDVTGYTWFMGSNVIWANVDCPNGYELPLNRNEARSAVTHGLYHYFSQFSSAPTSMFTQDGAAPPGTAKYFLDAIDTTPVDDAASLSDPVGMYCVDKG